MDITPFVYPPNDQEGVEVSPIVTALFSTELDEGTVTQYNAYLIKKSTEYSSNSLKAITSKVTLERVNLLTDTLFTGKDYGTGSDAGSKYRSRIKIEPLSPLDPHTEYSVILSKELATNSVFDIQLGVSNQTQDLLCKGPYTGLVDETYVVEITTGGSYADCKYKWKRLSDNHGESNLTGRKRFIELEQGVFIKFSEVHYYAGDTFTIKAKPLNKLNQIVAWNFTTGDASYKKPDDEKSTSVVQLPVEAPTAPPASATLFGIEALTPYDGQTMVKVGSKGTAAVNGIVFTTKTKTNTLNSKRIKLIPAETEISAYDQAGDIIIEVLETTTKQEVADLINGSTLPVVATTSLPSALAGLHQSGVVVQGGEIGGQVVIKFSKTIDQTKFDASHIQATFESLTDIQQGDLDFSYEITDNVLKIQF